MEMRKSYNRQQQTGLKCTWKILMQFEFLRQYHNNPSKQISSFPDLAKNDVVSVDNEFFRRVNSGNEACLAKKFKKKSPLTALLMMTAYGT